MEYHVTLTVADRKRANRKFGNESGLIRLLSRLCYKHNDVAASIEAKLDGTNTHAHLMIKSDQPLPAFESWLRSRLKQRDLKGIFTLKYCKPTRNPYQSLAYLAKLNPTYEGLSLPYVIAKGYYGELISSNQDEWKLAVLKAAKTSQPFA